MEEQTEGDPGQGNQARTRNEEAASLQDPLPEWKGMGGSGR